MTMHRWSAISAPLKEMQAEIDRINNELTTRTDYDSDDYMQLIEKVSSLSEKFYAIDMTHFEEDVEKTLLGLGFERSDFNRQRWHLPEKRTVLLKLRQKKVESLLTRWMVTRQQKKKTLQRNYLTNMEV